jgi:hypothetical protein
MVTEGAAEQSCVMVPRLKKTRQQDEHPDRTFHRAKSIKLTLNSTLNRVRIDFQQQSSFI